MLKLYTCNTFTLFLFMYKTFLNPLFIIDINKSNFENEIYEKLNKENRK